MPPGPVASWRGPGLCSGDPGRVHARRHLNRAAVTADSPGSEPVLGKLQAAAVLPGELFLVQGRSHHGFTRDVAPNAAGNDVGPGNGAVIVHGEDQVMEFGSQRRAIWRWP
jgi:hypothetical protein